jgi:hypothetical protein
MTPTWTHVSATDEFVRCHYCPALYRSAKQVARPYVCPVCIVNVGAVQVTHVQIDKRRQRRPLQGSR